MLLFVIIFDSILALQLFNSIPVPSYSIKMNLIRHSLYSAITYLLIIILRFDVIILIILYSIVVDTYLFGCFIFFLCIRINLLVRFKNGRTTKQTPTLRAHHGRRWKIKSRRKEIHKLQSLCWNTKPFRTIIVVTESTNFI